LQFNVFHFIVFSFFFKLPIQSQPSIIEVQGKKSVALVSKQIIPTERPPLVGEGSLKTQR
jgi:hypothetical protein